MAIIFSGMLSFFKAQNVQERAQKAMYSIIKKKRRLFDLPLDCQFDLFDRIVVPVFSYGCEIRGYQNITIIEREHLEFLKYVLKT